MQEALASFFAELAKLTLEWYLLPLVISATVWVLRQVQLGKAKLTQEQLLVVEMIVGVAIKAAEQSGLKGYIKDEAQSKLNYAINFVVEQLIALGFKEPDLVLIRNLIEAKLRDGVHKGYEAYQVGYSVSVDGAGVELPFTEIVFKPDNAEVAPKPKSRISQI